MSVREARVNFLITPFTKTEVQFWQSDEQLSFAYLPVDESPWRFFRKKTAIDITAPIIAMIRTTATTPPIMAAVWSDEDSVVVERWTGSPRGKERREVERGGSKKCRVERRRKKGKQDREQLVLSSWTYTSCECSLTHLIYIDTYQKHLVPVSCVPGYCQWCTEMVR